MTEVSEMLPPTVSPEGTNRPSIKELLLPIFIRVGVSDALRADSLGFWKIGEERFWLPRFRFQRTHQVKRRIKIGIFACIHGDEPAGALALVDLVRELDENPRLGREYEIWMYPICNPSGYVNCTRGSRSAKDLNREFWSNSAEPEVLLLEKELRTRRFDGIIALHSDDTSEGMYGFVRGATLTEHLLKPALAAAEEALPRNQGREIDGFHAVNGIIHSAYDGILSAPPGSQPQPFEIILETPQSACISLQRQAMVLALKAILSEYRRLISFAADI